MSVPVTGTRPLEEDSVLNLKMNEGAGEVAHDYSGEGNHGAFKAAGEPAWVEGRDGPAVEFDGVNDYINCGSDASIDDLTEFTWVFWIYQTGHTNNYAVIMRKGGKNLYAGATSFDGRIHVGIAAADVNAARYCLPGSIPDSVWARGAMTYSDSGDRIPWIYVDGVKLEGGTIRAAEGALDADAASVLYLGGNATGNSLQAKLDDPRIYNRILSDEEIKLLAR